MVHQEREPGDWLRAVLNHNTVKVDSTQEQRWVLVSCLPDCVNAGPWRVFLGAGERFFCSACGKEMQHRDE